MERVAGSNAIALWQQAATRYETEDDRPGQAFVLRFLATSIEDYHYWASLVLLEN